MSTKLLNNTTVFNIDNAVSVSCDTEDWHDYAENAALHHSNKYNFNI